MQNTGLREIDGFFSASQDLGPGTHHLLWLLVAPFLVAKAHANGKDERSQAAQLSFATTALSLPRCVCAS